MRLNPFSVISVNALNFCWEHSAFLSTFAKCWCFVNDSGKAVGPQANRQSLLLYTQTNVFPPWLNDSLTLSRSQYRGGCLHWSIWWGVPWMLPWKTFWKKSFPAPAAVGFSCCSGHLLCCSWAAKLECWAMEECSIVFELTLLFKTGEKDAGEEQHRAFFSFTVPRAPRKH